jgi:hypothetical protein
MALQQVNMPATRGEFRQMAARNQEVTQAAEPTREQSASLSDWFKLIFYKICANCPGWKNSIPAGGMDSIAGVWFEALTSRRDALNHDAISKGLLTLQSKRLTWLPHPLDFVDMCLDDGHALPSLADAMAEVREKAHSAKYRAKGDAEVTYSHPMIKHLAGQCGGLFLTGIGEKSAKEEFARQHKKAVEMANSGAFDAAANPQLEQKAEDENLAYYKTLVRDFAFMPSLAGDYLQACRENGIYIDVENETVTRDANLVDRAKVRGVRNAG